MDEADRYTPTTAGWLDTTTGLEWSHEAPASLTHADAIAWCKALDDEWRLPSIKELLTVVDYRLKNPATELPGTRSDFHWSSTTYRDFPDNAWGVAFFDGYVNADGKSTNGSVRAVRGGGKG